MAKRIVLLLDGTWNDIDAGRCDTNIVRMRDLISKHLVAASDHGELGNNTASKKVHGYTASGKEHIIYYERGVGTGAFDRFNGGAFGEGLSRNIRHAYKFLSFWYEPGDEIFVYGFSRGAYTARSLVGYLAATGLLRRDACNDERESLAWGYYRTPPYDRMPGVWHDLTEYVHNRDSFRVALLGVFDTVGSLGIPIHFAWQFNRDKYEFHDVELSSITDVNLHALAIDEHRWPFQATLWRMPAFKKYETVVEQVWFSGAHADVGGGYIVEESRDADTAYADDTTLDWMVRRTKHFYPDFPFDIDRRAKKTKDWSLAALHDSRRSIYGAWPFALRSIANSRTGASRWRYQREVSRDRHALPIGEMVHISAIERLLAAESGVNAGYEYKAQNLAKVIEFIRKTYEPKRGQEGEAASGLKAGLNHRTFELSVADWDGTKITNECHRAEQLRLLFDRHNQQDRSGFGVRDLLHAIEGWLQPKRSARL